MRILMKFGIFYLFARDFIFIFRFFFKMEKNIFFSKKI